MEVLVQMIFLFNWVIFRFHHQTFQVPKMELLTYIICMDTAYVRENPAQKLPYMVQYLRFRYLNMLVIPWYCNFPWCMLLRRRCPSQLQPCLDHTSTEEVDRSKARSVRAAPELSRRPCGRRGFVFLVIFATKGHKPKMCWSKPGVSNKSLPIIKDFRYPNCSKSLPSKHQLGTSWSLELLCLCLYSSMTLHSCQFVATLSKCKTLRNEEWPTTGPSISPSPCHFLGFTLPIPNTSPLKRVRSLPKRKPDRLPKDHFSGALPT